MVKGISRLQNETKWYRFFNITHLTHTSRVDHDKVYNNLTGKYNSLTPQEKKTVFDSVIGPITEMCSRLGYKLTYTKKTE